MDGKAFENTIINLKNLFEKLGTSLGDHFAKWIDNLTGPDGQKTIDGFFDGISRAGTVLVKLIDGLLTLGDWITSIMNPIRNEMHKFGFGLGDVVKSVTEVVLAMWGFKKVLGIVGAVKTLGGLLGGGAKAGVGAAERALPSLPEWMIGSEAAAASGTGLIAGSMALKGGAGKGLLSMLKGSAGGIAEGAGKGILGGLLKGGGKGLLRGLGGKGLLIGGALESLSYLSGEKSLSLKNLAKTGLSLGGGALGGLLGSAAGPLGTFAGGTGGYMAGDWLGKKLFGADDVPKGAKPNDAPKADDAPQNDDNQPSVDSQTERENHDNMAKMVDQMTEQTAVLHMMLTTLNSRLTETNRLLSNTNRSLS